MTLDDIKRLMLNNEFAYSAKVRALILDGDFSVDDLKEVILTADRIAKRERDELEEAVDGFKYTIIGRSIDGLSFYTAGKVLADYQGRYYFFITAHQAD